MRPPLAIPWYVPPPGIVNSSMDCGGRAPEGPLSIPPMVPPIPLESGVPAPLIRVIFGTLSPPIPPSFGADSPPCWPEIGTLIPLEVDLSFPPLIRTGTLVSLLSAALDVEVTGTVLLTNFAGPPITAIGTWTTRTALGLAGSAPGLGRADSAPLWTLGFAAFLGLTVAACGVGLADADWAALLGFSDSAPRLALTGGGFVTFAAGLAFGLAHPCSLNFL